MKPQYRLAVTAEADLAEILTYIAKDSVAAAERTCAQLRESCRRLAAMPGLGRERPELVPGVRSWLAGSYLVFYREAASGIEVLRFLHGARDLGVQFGEHRP